MTDQSERRGGFWTSLAGIITATAGFLGAVGTILGLLATYHLWPFPPETPQTPVAEKQGIVSASPTNQQFGDVPKGQSSDPLTITVSNGRSDTVNLGVAIKEDVSDSFSLASDGCTPTPVSATAKCALTVVFSPQATGLLSARIEVSAPGEATQIVLNGNGKLPGALSSEPTSLNFGLYTTGTTTPNQATNTLTLRNTGGVPLKINSLKSADSHFAPTTTCNKTLAPNEPCDVKVTFTLTTNTTINSILTADTSNGTFKFSLVGYRGPKSNIVKVQPGITINPSILQNFATPSP